MRKPQRLTASNNDQQQQKTTREPCEHFLQGEQINKAVNGNAFEWHVRRGLNLISVITSNGCQCGDR